VAEGVRLGVGVRVGVGLGEGVRVGVGLGVLVGVGAIPEAELVGLGPGKVAVGWGEDSKTGVRAYGPPPSSEAWVWVGSADMAVEVLPPNPPDASRVATTAV
jgi:hypothetical protein